MNFSITYASIFRVILILLSIWVLYHIIDVVAVLFFAIIIASAITPAVDRLREEGIPRLIAALLIYLAIGLALASIIYVLIPPMIAQLAKLSNQLPLLLKEYLGSLTIPHQFFERIQEVVAKAASGVGAWLLSLVGGIGNVVFVFIISFYLTVEDRAIKDFLRAIFPPKHQEYIMELIQRSQATLSSWLKAQIILMVLVGVITFIGLAILDIPYKLVLAVLIGVFEIVPFAGPVIAVIPALIFSLEVSPLTALFTAILYLAVQQIETQVLTPLVMKKTFQINPILVLVALFVGAKLGGIVGILASVPLLALGIEFIKDYYQRKPEKASQLQ